jgi:predicted acetyltransferase
MTQALRPVRVRPGEELAHARAIMRQFHEDATDQQLGRWLPLLRRPDYRGWNVQDGAEVVGTYGSLATSVSLPGGGRLPAAAVTAVGVAQTHRRRGLLRAMIEAGLDEAVEHGEPVALLWASESAIYPRFGFGVAAPSVVHHLDRAPTFRDPVDPGLVRAASLEDAEHAWPDIFERLRDQRGGCVTRNEAQWRLGMLEDPPDEREGASGRRLVHVPGRGYAAYRVKPGTEPSTLPEGEVRVQELVATDPEAEAALWQHVCDIDLTTRVVAWMRPPDDAIGEMLVDPLRARTAVGPPLYARLLDVVAAFEARAYDVADRLTIAVDDPDRDQSGTYLLDVQPGSVEVRRVADAPQLTLPIEACAAVWLGGTRATRLRAARRIAEHEPGAAARLDRLLAVERQPWTPFEF